MADGDEWTIPALREHYDRLDAERERRYEQRFLAQERAVQAALAAQEKAVAKAEAQAEQWRANANEWRAAMTDREQRFVTREAHDALESRVIENGARWERWTAAATGRGAGRSDVVALAFGAAGFIGAVVAIVVRVAGG